MDALERSVARISAFVGAAVLIAMMLQITVDVFMRNIVGAGFPATPDIVSRYYMVAVSFLPLAMTQIADRHIEATIFTDKLRGGARAAVLGLGILIGIAVFALLAYGTGAEAMKQTVRRAYVEAGTMHFPTWPSYWILPVSAALMLVVLMLRLLRLARGELRESGHDPLEEVTADIAGAGERE
jgi:TRAP-type C4-dicarboxylate transport system permease small subunit